MEHVHWTGTRLVGESLRNGQWKQAKEQIQHRCRTRPEVQARRLAIVIGVLIEGGRADDAVRLIKMFGGAR